ncbi:Nicotianamine synthase [Acorus gramineus]|uniref:Nicotianamine synthase n=1 Tax=Acorus gramineus TaxID=55184 RepID=A0AAV9BWL2_ACOGR|nr:Nicotianamine synthase [Acorus gramineus]
MGSQEDKALVNKVFDLYHRISALPSLEPSATVDDLFTRLVRLCIPPIPLDVTALGAPVPTMRARLIRLCGEAEGLLESHYASLLSASAANPLDRLSIFPYYENYLKLSLLEHTILSEHAARAPENVAFVGSGPLPLTSIVLATRHLRGARFHNYDFDAEANEKAARLVRADPDLSARMAFHTVDVMDVAAEELRRYDVVFLAALVGLCREDKVRVIDHLGRHMAPGALLMLRSAHGARAFLYPVVDEADLRGWFDVLSVFHPEDEVVNSVVIARRRCAVAENGRARAHGHVQGRCPIVFPSKCKCMDFGLSHAGRMEEMVMEEQQTS